MLTVLSESDPCLQQLDVEPCMIGERLDIVLTQTFPDLSRTLIQRLIKEGQVTLQEKALKVSYRLREGDQFLIEIPPQQECDILAEDIPLDILYEDDDLLVVNKQKGMVVHPCPGHYSGTLVNAVMYHCAGHLSGINGVMRPGIVHRIDRNTTGSLVVCKNDAAHRSLAEQLKAHTINRRYRALVWGNLFEDSGTVDAPIGRHPVQRKKMAVNWQHGKNAVTHYHVLERFGEMPYIECILETGRTHQIRVHMTSIGHPLVGDDIYGSARKLPFSVNLQGQTLHAMILGFIHPTKGNYVEFCAPLPEYFEELLEKLRKTVHN